MTAAPRLTAEQQRLALSGLRAARAAADAFVRLRPSLRPEREDTRAAALEALALAALRYDASRGVAWTTYVNSYVRWHLSRATARFALVRTEALSTGLVTSGAPLERLHEVVPGHESTTWLEVLPSPEPSPEAHAERLQLQRRLDGLHAYLLQHELERAVSRDKGRRRADVVQRRRARARRDVGWWWAVRVGGCTYQSLAAKAGCVRDLVRQVVVRLDAVVRLRLLSPLEREAAREAA